MISIFLYMLNKYIFTCIFIFFLQNLNLFYICETPTHRYTFVKLLFILIHYFIHAHQDAYIKDLSAHDVYLFNIASCILN